MLQDKSVDVFCGEYIFPGIIYYLQDIILQLEVCHAHDHNSIYLLFCLIIQFNFGALPLYISLHYKFITHVTHENMNYVAELSFAMANTELQRQQLVSFILKYMGGSHVLSVLQLDSSSVRRSLRCAPVPRSRQGSCV